MIPNSTVHTESIVSSPQQQWLGESVTLLLYNYIAYVFHLPKVIRQNMVVNIMSISQNKFI
jgi:glucose uptake protein GlcU